MTYSSLCTCTMPHVLCLVYKLYKIILSSSILAWKPLHLRYARNPASVEFKSNVQHFQLNEYIIRVFKIHLFLWFSVCARFTTKRHRIVPKYANWDAPTDSVWPLLAQDADPLLRLFLFTHTHTHPFICCQNSRMRKRREGRRRTEKRKKKKHTRAAASVRLP